MNQTTRWEDLKLSGYEEPPERALVIDAQTEIVWTLVQLHRASSPRQDPARDRVWARQIRSMLDTSIWKVTEIDRNTESKYHAQRYISEDARKLFEEHNEGKLEHLPGGKLLVHEHVIPRKELINQLLAAGSENDVRHILSGAVACVVTPKEHARLKMDRNDAASGWSRYERARIRVWDRQTGRWLDLHAPASAP